MNCHELKLKLFLRCVAHDTVSFVIQEQSTTSGPMYRNGCIDDRCGQMLVKEVIRISNRDNHLDCFLVIVRSDNSIVF
jgi:hypothetical protein